MGYRHNRKTYKLVFEDPELDGLVVRVKSTSVGNLLDIMGLLAMNVDDIRREDLSQLDHLFRSFAEALVEWNVEDDDGTPVPPTYEGVRGQDTDFVIDVIRVWYEALSGVPGPLPATSSDGGPSLEQSMPMEPRSPSPPR